MLQALQVLYLDRGGEEDLGKQVHRTLIVSLGCYSSFQMWNV